MLNLSRFLANGIIEELDNQLRVLTQEKDEAASETLRAELDKRIARRLQERAAWERVLVTEGPVRSVTVLHENQKKAS